MRFKVLYTLIACLLALLSCKGKGDLPQALYAAKYAQADSLSHLSQNLQALTSAVNAYHLTRTDQSLEHYRVKSLLQIGRIYIGYRLTNNDSLRWDSQSEYNDLNRFFANIDTSLDGYGGQALRDSTYDPEFVTAAIVTTAINDVNQVSINQDIDKLFISLGLDSAHAATCDDILSQSAERLYRWRKAPFAPTIGLGFQHNVSRLAHLPSTGGAYASVGFNF